MQEKRRRQQRDIQMASGGWRHPAGLLEALRSPLLQLVVRAAAAAESMPGISSSSSKGTAGDFAFKRNGNLSGSLRFIEVSRLALPFSFSLSLSFSLSRSRSLRVYCCCSCSEQWGDRGRRDRILCVACAAGLRLLQPLNLWVAAMPSEVSLPLQQQQRQRMLLLPAVDLLLLHSEPLGFVVLSAGEAQRGTKKLTVLETTVSSSAAAVTDTKQHQLASVPHQVSPELFESARKKRPWGSDTNGRRHSHGSSSSSSSRNSSNSSSCCCCCRFFTNAAAGPAAEPLQVALSLG